MIQRWCAFFACLLFASFALRPDAEEPPEGGQQHEVARHWPELLTNAFTFRGSALLEFHSTGQLKKRHQFPRIEARGNNTGNMKDQRCQKRPTCDAGNCDQRGAEDPTCNGGGCKQQESIRPRCSPFDKASNSIITCDQTEATSPRCDGLANEPSDSASEQTQRIPIDDEIAFAKHVGQAEVRKAACDQSGSTTPMCNSGHCDQSGSSGASCAGGWCDQEHAENPTCSRHCLQMEAENPLCELDCLSEVDSLLTDVCPEGGCYQQRRNGASCEKGFCDQTYSEGAVCQGGHCDQSHTKFASCPGGDCDQSSSEKAKCAGGHCDREDAEDPLDVKDCSTCYQAHDGSSENDCETMLGTARVENQSPLQRTAGAEQSGVEAHALPVQSVQETPTKPQPNISITITISTNSAHSVKQSS